MHSIEDQMKEIKRLKGIYQAMKSLRRKMIAEAVSAGVCVVMMISVVSFLPELRQASEQAPIRQSVWQSDFSFAGGRLCVDRASFLCPWCSCDAAMPALETAEGFGTRTHRRHECLVLRARNGA